MTITRTVRHFPLKYALLFGALVLALPGIAGAWQSTRQPVIRPVPSNVANLRFQQVQQQQHTIDQLQKSQLQQQLRQSVSDNARRPTTSNVLSQQQLDEADRARSDRERARQQDLLDRERDNATLPRVVPKALPAPAHSSR
ncbi:hypothetical protein ACPPVV_10850 [Rhodanobacter sp. Col0626]|uniref:hypothetical protein n=1 Tax=Rhodanobacter sp. Col0626 TaxID=3415679 RepID=UPI003CF256A4